MAKERAAKAGLSDRCKFELVDYRALNGTFDRVVSVGMFEHVGVHYYPTYFAKVRDLLKDDGVALIHTIGRSGWTRRHQSVDLEIHLPRRLYPRAQRNAAGDRARRIDRHRCGSPAPPLCRNAEGVARRFKAHWHEAAELYDERFCRMWEFYLAGAEMAFRHEGLVVFQVQLAKRVDALPLTRDYMLESERTMQFAGVEEMPRQSRAA